MEKQTFVVAVEHEFMGQWHTVGTPLSMTARAANTRRIAGTLVTEAAWKAMQAKTAEADKTSKAKKRAESGTEAETKGAE